VQVKRLRQTDSKKESKNPTQKDEERIGGDSLNTGGKKECIEMPSHFIMNKKEATTVEGVVNFLLIEPPRGFASRQRGGVIP